MTDDRTGRELTPRPSDDSVTTAPERSSDVDRFYAGDQAHTVGLTEERAAQIVKQSGSARYIAFLASIVIVLFIPLYWFYELGLPALGVEGRQGREETAQYVTDVARGYELYEANCAQCHGPEGEGGVGPPLNDQAKLYNALTADGLAGTGHLNPDYLESVLREGGRIVCGDPESVMPAWLQPKGPLNYRQIEELIAFLTASTETTFVYQPDHAEAGETLPPPETLSGWRDPNYSPEPGAPTPPACWRPYENPAFATSGAGASAAPIESPGTADAPRVIELVETADLRITDPEGNQVTQIAVQPGETVEFAVTNEAGFAHNFFIGEPAALEANAQDQLEGIPDFVEGTQRFTWEVTEGEGLQFACTVPGHYEPMHGELAFVGGQE